jgi:hypothetical protein
VRAYLAALAARRTLILLLEDLHWADPASLDLLRIVARDWAGLPVLALATYRDHEVARGHPLDALLPILVREARAGRLALRPLTPADLRGLIRSRSACPPADEDRLVPYLSERTDGNPLYAGEVLRALGERGVLPRDVADAGLGDLEALPVPTLLRQVIDGRVARLGGVVGIALACEARARPSEDYTLFAQLIGPDGQVRGQYDAPAGWTSHYTAAWSPGERVALPWAVPLDAGPRPAPTASSSACIAAPRPGLSVSPCAIRAAMPPSIGPVNSP